MIGTIKIGRLLGFEIQVHWSWFFILFLVTASFATSLLKNLFPELTDAQRWVVAGFIAVLFFGSILVHELSHSLMARHYNISVPSITLFVFGGVSSLSKDPETPRQEFWIAIVGPTTSIGIAMFLGLAYLPLHELDHGLGAISANLALINLAIGVFNLIPGFPLDGGRVLRSLFWIRKREIVDATRLASKVSQMVAYLIMATGVVLFLVHDAVSGIWFFLIGNFLKGASEASYSQLFTDRILKDVPVSVVTSSEYIAVSPEVTLFELTGDHVLTGHGRCFLVAAGEELLGLFTVTDLRGYPRETWRTTTVYRAMTPFAHLKTVSPKDDLTSVLALMAEADLNQIPLVDGKLIRGIIHRSDVLRYIQTWQELGEGSRDAVERSPGHGGENVASWRD